MNNLQYMLIISALASLMATGPNLASVPPYAFAGNGNDDDAAGDDGNNKFAVDYKNILNDKNTMDITTASSLSPGTLGSNVNQGQQGPAEAAAGQAETQGQQGPAAAAAGPPARSLDVVERNSDRANVSPGAADDDKDDSKNDKDNKNRGPPRELQIIERSSGDVVVPPGFAVFARANCQTGELATGGGYYLNRVLLNTVSENALPANSGWQVEAYNPNQDPFSFRAFAECASLIP